VFIFSLVVVFSVCLSLCRSVLDIPITFMCIKYADVDFIMEMIGLL